MRASGPDNDTAAAATAATAEKESSEQTCPNTAFTLHDGPKLPKGFLHRSSSTWRLGSQVVCPFGWDVS